jgi:hypothetical protein
VGRSLDSFRAARGVAGLVPTDTVKGGIFGDGAAGRLPGVNQNAWLASRAGEGVHFVDSKRVFVRAAPHPRRPSMLHRVSADKAQGALASLHSYRTPSALARMVSRNNHLRCGATCNVRRYVQWLAMLGAERAQLLAVMWRRRRHVKGGVSLHISSCILSLSPKAVKP